MLGLAEQVGGENRRIGGLVRDDQDLRRAGDEVDADLPEEAPLRLDDIRVARSGEEVDRRDRFRSECHCRERLHAAEHVDLVGSGEVHGRDGRVRHATVRAGACRRRRVAPPRPWR